MIKLLNIAKEGANIFPLLIIALPILYVYICIVLVNVSITDIYIYIYEYNISMLFMPKQYIFYLVISYKCL